MSYSSCASGLGLGLLVALCCSLLDKPVFAESQGCVDIPTEANFKIEDVEGTWYPMEIVLHRNDSKIYGVPTDTQCPTVTFSTVPRSKKTLIMTWNSTDGDLEYRFQQKGGARVAQWQAAGDQTGTLVNDQYKNFGGIVRVIKLDGDFMFLSFCSLKSRLLSTVAFSRKEEMPEDVFNETLELLEARNYKRAREIHVRPCQEDPNTGPRACSLSLLAVLPGLFLRVRH